MPRADYKHHFVIRIVETAKKELLYETFILMFLYKTLMIKLLYQCFQMGSSQQTYNLAIILSLCDMLFNTKQQKLSTLTLSWFATNYHFRGFSNNLIILPAFRNRA